MFTTSKLLLFIWMCKADKTILVRPILRCIFFYVRSHCIGITSLHFFLDDLA